MKWTALVALYFLLFACNSEIERLPAPKNLIPRDTMVMVLQDLVVLESYVTNEYPQVNKYQQLMKNTGDTLLQKYNLTFQRFNRSFDYYGSRQDEMQAIYSEVQDSLTWKVNHLQ